MISHCANPACNKPFHYLRGGRLYRFDTAGPGHCSKDVANAVCASTPTRTAVFFWLCRECCSKVSLEFNGNQLWVKPLRAAARGSGRSPVIAVGEFHSAGQTPAEDWFGRRLHRSE